MVALRAHEAYKNCLATRNGACASDRSFVSLENFSFIWYDDEASLLSRLAVASDDDDDEESEPLPLVARHRTDSLFNESVARCCCCCCSRSRLRLRAVVVVVALLVRLPPKTTSREKEQKTFVVSPRSFLLSLASLNLLPPLTLLSLVVLLLLMLLLLLKAM
jgi:hypothetical protein